MPLYEYGCQECGARFEVLQKLKERALKKAECDACGEVRPVRRLVSAPAFQFKGEGWYVTDYAKKGAKGKEGSSEGSSESSSDSVSEAKGADTKPGAEKKKGSGSKKDKAAGSKKGSRKSGGGD